MLARSSLERSWFCCAVCLFDEGARRWQLLLLEGVRVLEEVRAATLDVKGVGEQVAPLAPSPREVEAFSFDRQE